MDNNQADESIFDEHGYRFNVAIIIINSQGQAFWGKRRGQNSWQFPQGGVNAGESAEQAMLRELYEETGLEAAQVEIIAETEQWLKYRLPVRYRRRRRPGVVQCIGQKQKWYLLRLKGGDECINLQSCQKPEFDDWQWVDYWLPIEQVVNFKRKVYKQALDELAAHVPNLAASTSVAADIEEKPRHNRYPKRRKAPSFAKRNRSNN